jgi:glycosyltransferase involved in cell wall biosynthesis
LKDVPPNVEIHEIGGRARTASLPVARLCWKLKPKAVLSTSAHLNSAVIAARRLLPQSITFLAREGADIHSPEFSISRVRLFMYKLVYRDADVVICQSDHMKKVLIRKFGLAETKVVRIYNPVDTERIARLAASEPNPFIESGVNIVGVGRLSHEKGFDALLRCMSMIRGEVPKAKLTLVGDGPDLEALRKLQHELRLDDCVEFAGRCQNPYPFIRHATLLVLPSRTEALPNLLYA